MKPLVGNNLDRFMECLAEADRHLAEAEKLAFGAYGSSMITLDIRTARYLTKDSSFRRSNMAYLKPPMTRKVRRMLKQTKKGTEQ